MKTHTYRLKKVIAVLLAAGVVTASLTALADEEIKVYVDGEQLTFDVNPIIDNARTLVPMRAIFEALGADVTWEQDTKTASATRGADTVSITIDSNTLYKNNEAVELDVPAKIIDDRTLVPVRAISESFDAEVLWNGETQSVIITTAKEEEEETPDSTAEPEAVQPSKGTESNALTDEDMEELKSKKELIRYEYEQSALPKYVFEHSDTIYTDMDDPEDFGQAITGLWDGVAAGYAIDVQINSETEYKLSDELSSEDALLDYYIGIVKEAELDSEAVIDGVVFAESEEGAKICVVILQSADSLVQCKYLGIVASEKDKPRYFTAENDLTDSENWYFCEVTEEGRGTLSIFEKKDENTDLQTFITGANNVYTNKK